MTLIKQRSQDTSSIIKELLSEKYKSNQTVVSKLKKIQEAYKKETDKFGELAKEISKKSYILAKSKSIVSER